MLEEGTILISEKEKHYVIEKLLGEGGRLCVYEVIVTETGERKALRWYKHRNESFEKKIHANLMLLTSIDSPDTSLIWVDDVVCTTEHGLGYITSLIPEGYIPSFKLVRGSGLSPSAKCNFAIDLLRSFYNTRMKGFLLFTADGADGWLVHPETGHLLIEECERTAPIGQLPYPMLFNHKYAAPEVILGKRSLDTHTNLFSVAVVLFMLFFDGHPLEGKQGLSPCLIPQLEKRIYGEDPVFVFDPIDDRNCPESVIHSKMISSWNEAPDYLKDIFIKAFSKEALHNPSARPYEEEIAKAIYRYRAELNKK